MAAIWTICFGIVGVLSRYGVDLLMTRVAQSLPWGTLGINVLGSFLAGWVYVLGVERGALTPDLRTGLMVGFLGGFTTFSAYCLQSVRLLESGEPGAAIRALAYLAGSPILGFGACWIAVRMARG